MDSQTALSQIAVLISAEHRDQLRAVNDEHTKHMQMVVHNMHSVNEVNKAQMVNHCESKLHEEVESAARTSLYAVAHMNAEIAQNGQWAKELQLGAIEAQGLVEQMKWNVSYHEDWQHEEYEQELTQRALQQKEEQEAARIAGGEDELISAEKAVAAP